MKKLIIVKVILIIAIFMAIFCIKMDTYKRVSKNNKISHFVINEVRLNDSTIMSFVTTKRMGFSGLTDDPILVFKDDLGYSIMKQAEDFSLYSHDGAVGSIKFPGYDVIVIDGKEFYVTEYIR